MTIANIVLVGDDFEVVDDPVQTLISGHEYGRKEGKLRVSEMNETAIY